MGRKSRSTGAGNGRPVPASLAHHSPYTFEGQIERLGIFASGVRRRKGWRRLAGRILTLVILLPFLVGIVAVIIQHLRPEASAGGQVRNPVPESAVKGLPSGLTTGEKGLPCAAEVA